MINLDDQGPSKRRLKVVKSRYGNLGDTIEFEFAGELDYKLTKPAEQAASKVGKMADRILQAVSDSGSPGTRVQRGPLAERLGIQPKAAEERCFERALKRLVKEGKLRHPFHGSYALPTGSDNSDNLPDPRELQVSADN